MKLGLGVSSAIQRTTADYAASVNNRGLFLFLFDGPMPTKEDIAIKSALGYSDVQHNRTWYMIEAYKSMLVGHVAFYPVLDSTEKEANKVPCDLSNMTGLQLSSDGYKHVRDGTATWFLMLTSSDQSSPVVTQVNPYYSSGAWGSSLWSGSIGLKGSGADLELNDTALNSTKDKLLVFYRFDCFVGQDSPTIAPSVPPGKLPTGQANQFLGEVLGSDLIKGSDLLDMVLPVPYGSTFPSLNLNPTVWLKYLIKGKILFFPKENIASNFFATYNNSVVSREGKPIKIKGNLYLLRYIRDAAEWVDLVHRIAGQAALLGQDAEYWADYTAAQLDEEHFVPTSAIDSWSQVYLCGGVGLPFSGGWSSGQNMPKTAYRPVLELIE